MYTRMFKPPLRKSFFLFGPRGTGKTHWLKTTFPQSLYFDLLDAKIFLEFQAQPGRLDERIPANFPEWVIIDEVQKIPELLNEVHRLIEHKGYRFILTGSSARSLRRKGVNLLAGRAITCKMHPLTSQELGADFSLERALSFGLLPAIYSEENPKKYLDAYVGTYLREEVQQEGLTRNLGAFARFLEIASFSQGAVINVAEIARESYIDRKIAENYFEILQDLLLASLVPVFTKRAKRRLVAHPKFYYFDTGVFRSIRPKGPFDRPEEAEGAALETLVYQELLALNDYLDLEYQIFYWRTSNQIEVDFILYGPRGLIALEIKRSKTVGFSDLNSLKAFAEDYPEAKLFLLYGGPTQFVRDGVQMLPFTEAFQLFPQIL